MIKETIWAALMRKLGRQPTNAEAKAECKRIMADAVREMAEKGRLSFQRRR